MTASDRQSALKDLLTQYQEYQRATTTEEKQRISNSMFFADPIVWMKYKFLAYQGTKSALNTWGDLIDHSLGHDGICGKRLNWLVEKARFINVDILSESVLARKMLIDEVVKTDLILEISNSELLMKEWCQYEFYKDGGQNKKWANYQLTQ